ncbi:MAG: phosphopantothenoylcysteine decarboxylase [Clostridiales Family XIII bacterium]|nr:phosphopantothenoylcysteine decarboxylase [Clostridiales Family XIII bacterium]
MKNIVLGVTGSIAAYRAADIANSLTKSGHSVSVVMTEAATRFVCPLTFQTLTKNRVYTDMFELVEYREVKHVSLAKRADLLLIAPATANIIGKLASGIADDMLSAVAMAACGAPVLICPAMNTAMYENPVTQGNIKKLESLGYRFVEPRESVLACGDLGRGAMAELGDIIAAAESLL